MYNLTITKNPPSRYKRTRQVESLRFILTYYTGEFDAEKAIQIATALNANNYYMFKTTNYKIEITLA